MKKRRMSSFADLDKLSNSQMKNVVGGNLEESKKISNANTFKDVTISPTNNGIKGVWYI